MQAEVCKSESGAFCKEIHELREKMEDLLEDTKEMARRVAQLADEGSIIISGRCIAEKAREGAKDTSRRRKLR